MKNKRSIFIKRVMAWLLTLTLIVPMLASNIVFADDENTVQKKDFSGYITGNELINAEGKSLGKEEGESVDISDTLTLRYDYAITDSISIDDMYTLPVPSGLTLDQTASGSAIIGDSGEIGTLQGGSGTPYYIKFSSEITGTQDALAAGTVDISCGIDPAAVQNGTVNISMVKGQQVELAVTGMIESDVSLEGMPIPEKRTNFGDFFTSPPTSTFATMDGASLKVKRNGVYADLDNNAALSLGDELQIRYNWYITEDDLLVFTDAQPSKKLDIGSVFNLPDITYILPNDSGSASSKVSVKVDGKDETLGTLSWNTASNDTSFKFEMAFDENNIGGIQNGYFEYYCKLNGASIPENDEVIQVEVGENIYTITVEERKKVETKLEKKGTESNGEVKWEAVITSGTIINPGNTPGLIEDDANFIDNLPAGLTYITDSFEYRKGDSGNFSEPDPSEFFTFTENNVDDSGTLEWQMPKLAIGEKLYIRYKTVLSDKTIAASSGTNSYTNSASIQLKNSKTLTDTAAVSINSSGSKAKWIQKVTEGGFDPSTKKTKWKLTINGNSRNIKDVSIYDIMSKEQVIDGDVLFTVADGVPSVVTTEDVSAAKWNDIINHIPSSSLPSYVNSSNYKIIKFDLSGSGIESKNISKDSKITYTTELSTNFGSDTDVTSKREFYNGAWLEFNWLHYSRPGSFDTGYEAPGMGVPYDVWALDVQKDFVKYDRSNQRITWRVTINGDHFTMNDIKVTDTIGSKQQYVTDSIRNVKSITADANGKDEDTIDYLDDDIDVLGTGVAGSTIVYRFKPFLDPDNDPDLNLNDFGTNKIQFEFDTKATDSADFANGDTLLKNSSDYTNSVTISGNINGQAVSLSAPAVATVESQVLEKTVTRYNYKDHTMTWTVSVNHNEMLLEDVELEDEIPEGMYLLKDTLAFKTNPEGKTLNYTYQDSAGRELSETDCQSGKKLTVTLGSVNKKLVLTYKTKVDVNYSSDSYKSLLEEHGTDKIFKNSVTLRRKTYDDVNTDENCTVTNPFVQKTGKALGASDKQDTIAYDITINPNSVALPANSSHNFLYDKLPLNLELDENSIQLYECFIGETPGEVSFIDGDELKGIQKEPGTNPGDGIGSVSKGQYIYTYNKNSGDLFVYLPAGESKPYRLKFNTFVVQLGGDSGQIQNSASFGSLSGSSSSGETISVDVSLKVKGEAEAGTRTGNVAFVKTDTSGLPLAGAEFTLKSNSPAITKVDTVISGTDGKIEFSAKSLGEYTLKETKAPEGYMLDTRSYAVKIGKMKSAVTNKIVPYYSIKLEDASLAEIDGSYVLSNQTLGKITVKKVAEDNTTLLSGATFKLEKKNDADFAIQTAKTGAGGTCSFEGLEAGIYIVTETVAPDGYQIDTQSQEVAVAGPGSIGSADVSLTFINYIAANITILKTDAITKQPLPDATFILYSVDASNHKTPVGEPRKTDADGKIVFRNLEYGKYEIAETLAAPGYILNTVSETVEVTKGSGSKTISFENHPYGKITILKADAITKQPLPDATFTLYSIDASNQKTPVGEPRKTDADGKIVFRDLEYGKYEIAETLAAPGYILNTASETVELLKDSESKTISFKNQPYGKISIQKTNATTGEWIPFVEFTLKSGTTVLQTGITDENGTLTFTNVSDGTYEVTETKPAPGYMPNTTVYTVVVDRVKLHPVIPVQNQHYGVLDITKVGSGTEPEKLKGVEFALYKLEPIVPMTITPETAAETKDGTVPPDAVPVDKKTTDENGTLTFENIPYGSYILRELTTADGYILKEYPLDVITFAREKYHFEYTIVNEKKKKEPSGGGGGGTPDVPGTTPAPSVSPSPSILPTPSVSPAAEKTPKPEKTIRPSAEPTRKPNVPSNLSDPMDTNDADLDLTDPDVPAGYSSPIVPGEPAGVEIGDEDTARGALDPDERTPKIEMEEDLNLGDMDPATGYKLPQTGERSGADTLVLIGGCLVLIGGIFLGVMKIKARKKE